MDNTATSLVCYQSSKTPQEMQWLRYQRVKFAWVSEHNFMKNGTYHKNISDAMSCRYDNAACWQYFGVFVRLLIQHHLYLEFNSAMMQWFGPLIKTCNLMGLLKNTVGIFYFA